jgi:hypothetical protein
MMHATAVATVDAGEVVVALERADIALRDENIDNFFFGMQAIPYFQKRTDSRFNSESWSGGKWAELTPMTQRFREYQGFPPEHPINVRTGELRDWLGTDEGDRRRTGGMAELTWPGSSPSSLTEMKLETAQTGARARTARPVVEVTEVDAAFLLGTLEGYFKAALRGIFF